MREILFRGKDIKTKEWVEGYYVKSKLHWHKRGIHEDWIITSALSNGGYFSVAGRYAVDKDTVSQYTEWKDKNGLRIFEGDIVKYEAINKKKLIGVIEFHNSAFSVRWLDFSNYGRNFIGYLDDLEVIGNIFDNPELIK